MAREELVGFYGKLAQAATSEISTGTLTANTKYIVKTIGSGPSTIPSGVEVGKAFVADGTEDITSSGDVVIELTETDKCDITQWAFDLTKPEIDVSTLCDEVSKYLAGRPDLSGTLEGIYKIGVTDADDGILNSFVDIARQATGPGGTVVVDQAGDGQLILLLYKQKDTTSGETEQVYVAPVTITSYSDTVSGQDAQAFTSAFRIAPNDDIDFHLLSVTHP